MAGKKEPPFYNEDKVGTFQYKLPFYQTMELSIETLTGTCFQLRASRFETVVSVKAKIQRLEGIPIAQQHLIWNDVELEDECCLHDYNIAEGCTLKLVLAMRGGPINTRRVALDDPVREMAEFMDASQDEVWEKPQPSKQVTFLVYREGDQLNFFRVIDRGDGTLTPVTESISGGSVYNLYAEEEEEEEEGESLTSSQQTIENYITMHKMKLLKAKMENMNLNKKPKKTAKLKPRPPLGPRPCSGSLGPSRHPRTLRVLPQIGQSLAPAAHLPPIAPIGDQAVAAASPGAASALRDQEAWKCPLPAKIRPPPKVSRLEVGGSKLLKDCVFSALPVLSSTSAPGGPRGQPELKTGQMGLMEESDPQNAIPFRDSRPDALSLGLSALNAPGADPLAEMGVSEPPPLAPLLSRVIGSGASDAWPTGGDHASHIPGHSSSDPASIWQPLHSSLLRAEQGPALATSPPPRTAPFRGVRVDPGRRVEVISKSEARSITEMANKAEKEPLGSVRNLGLLASLGHGGSREGLHLRQEGLHLRQEGLHLRQEDLLRKVACQHGAVASYMCPGGSSSSIRRIGTPPRHLPPVKVPAVPKKKSSKHCFLCGKKTGLATSYECRCGNNFCAVHRYAEAHECTYDYKSAGRRLLQEAHPIVSAPKLPKI